MWPEQMASRCPDSWSSSAAELPGWRFLINERGVATIVEDDVASVFGATWHLGPGDLVALDRFEGVAEGRYNRTVLRVATSTTAQTPVVVYVDPRENAGVPRPGYLDKVIAGARHFNLPEHYIDAQLDRDWSSL